MSYTFSSEKEGSRKGGGDGDGDGDGGECGDVWDHTGWTQMEDSPNGPRGGRGRVYGGAMWESRTLTLAAGRVEQQREEWY